MNKENKKMAQQRRAEERKKKARKELIQKIIIAVIIVAVIGGMIIYGVIDSKNNSDSSGDTSADSTTEVDTSADTTEDTDADTTDDTGVTYNTDTSLVVADGDVVNIDYVGSIDGVEFSGGTGNYDLEIGSHSFIDDFEEQLIGHNVGETVDVYATFPDSYSGTYTDADGESQALAGTEALFVVTINGIYE